jgi:hypothetical protein
VVGGANSRHVDQLVKGGGHRVIAFACRMLMDQRRPSAGMTDAKASIPLS